MSIRIQRIGPDCTLVWCTYLGHTHFAYSVKEAIELSARFHGLIA